MISLLTFPIKEIADARAIRNKILTNFELATQLNTSLEERKRLLHFVVVGGGPTGVEFSAEFYDFLVQVRSLDKNLENLMRIFLNLFIELVLYMLC